jgi:hypothetical protein
MLRPFRLFDRVVSKAGRSGAVRCVGLAVFWVGIGTGWWSLAPQADCIWISWPPNGPFRVRFRCQWQSQSAPEGSITSQIRL